MEPVLKKWPQKKRNLAFAPILIGMFLVGFIVGAVITPEFVIALLVASAVGAGGAYALVGWPHLTTKGGKPLVPPKVKPWLFFLVAPVAALAVYVVLGVFLTPVLPPEYLAWITLAVGVLAGCAFAYFVVGFPNVTREVRSAWDRVPPARRPFLFFPLAILLFLVSYFLVGLAFTQFTSDFLPLEVQPLVVLPLSLVLGGVAAFLLVGFPKPQKPLKEYVPDVPGRHRPAAFLVTWVVLGLPFTYAAGVAFNALAALPHDAVLPAALATGYVVAGLVSVIAWGTPKKWNEDPDYEPGLPEGARTALFVPVVLATALVGAMGVNLAGLDLFWGLLAGTIVGLVLALKVTGLGKKLKELRGESPYLLPELPDKIKPLVLFPLWGVLTFALTVPVAYALPELLPVILAVAALIGLAVAVLLVEEPTLREVRARRKAEKERARAFKQRRAEALKDARGKKA